MDVQILLVEDSLTQAKQYQHDLETAGLRVELARDGRDALAKLESLVPRLIISDIKMPEMNGFDLCRAIKQQERLRGVPFVLLTSLTEPQDVLHSLAVGADGFISKSASRDDMLASISNWLEHKEAAAQLPSNKHVRFDYQGFTYRIPADIRHILEFLVHTYWMAIRHNYELERIRNELDQTNQELEQRYHELLASESRFHSLVRTIPDIVYQITPEGRFTFINEAVARLGFNPAEVVGRHFEEIITPLESRPIARTKALSQLTSVLVGEVKTPLKLVDERRTGERQTRGLVVELLVKTDTPDSDRVFAEINSAGLYEVYPESGGRVFLGTVGVMRDITDRRRMEQELKDAYEGLEAKVQERTRALSRSNTALLQEITERKQAESELRENELLLQSILDGIRAAVFFVDPESMVIVDCNPMAETLLALPRKKIIGASSCDFLYQGQDHAKSCQRSDDTILNRDALVVDGGGHAVPVLKSILPAVLKGHPIQVEIIIDMTEHKALERQLAYAQKLESIGQLAAGIAHEINTPIQYLGGNLEFLRSSFAGVQSLLDEYGNLLEAARAHPGLSAAVAKVDEVAQSTHVLRNLSEVSGALEDSEDGLDRVSSIVMAMKKFSHPDVEEKKPVDVNEAIKNTITIARNEWKYYAEVSQDLAPDLPVAQLVPGDFNQVMLNVVVNAAHAVAEKVGRSGQKGEIAISTRPDGEYLEVRVRDTGIGIPEENRHKIFDPFFTTKAPGKGTGQGLSITHTIVKKHGGSIDFESIVGKGTTFIVRFPFKERAPEVK